MPVAAVPRSVGGDRAATRRAVLNTLKGSSGNLVEWYDVYVFAVFGVYFAPRGPAKSGVHRSDLGFWGA